MRKVDTSSKGGSLRHLSPTRSTDAAPRLRHANLRQKAFSPRSNALACKSPVAGEGYHKLKIKLTSHGLPETVVNELIEHHTPVNYPRGSMIFLQGAPTDLIYWVSSGLVDILCPEPEGGQIQTSLLGPGDIFGFVEFSDFKGNPAQAFQSRDHRILGSSIGIESQLIAETRLPGERGLRDRESRQEGLRLAARTSPWRLFIPGSSMCERGALLIE